MRFRQPRSTAGRRCRGFSTVTIQRAVLAAFLIITLGLYVIRARTLPNRDACQILDMVTPKLDRESKLPKIVHQLWPKIKMPYNVARWFIKWRELFPGIEHKIWDDDAMRDLIATDFPWFFATYQSYPANIMRVDAARTFILYKYGGVYADIDYEPQVNFWDRLPDDRPSLIESFWGHERFQNSFMVSPPRHEFWNYTWTMMMRRDEEKKEKGKWDTMFLTGPGMIDAAVEEWNNDHPDVLIHTLPCQNWHRVSTGHQTDRHQALIRAWQYYFDATFKRCGSVFDARCQMGIHYSRSMWFDE